MRKGFVLTWDVMIAVTLVLLVFVSFLFLPGMSGNIESKGVGFGQAHLKSEDAIEVLSKRGVLEKIGRLWAEGNFSSTTELQQGEGYYKEATNITKRELDAILPPSAGYTLEIGGDRVYSSELDPDSKRPDSGEAKDKTRAVRFISGFEDDRPVSGWAARAVLVQNLTGSIQELEYGGTPAQRQIIELNNTYDEKVAYLVIPLGAQLFDAKMNVSWNPNAYASGEPDPQTGCPMLI
ncbi:MAG: hypothetical protein V1921_00595 [Candidatus Altiarchaeota archaeon]